MKKNLFLWWLIALMFSCAYEIEAPPALEENITVKFSVEDARKHFEENATDLTFIRLSKPNTVTKSKKQDNHELIPDWGRASLSANEEATLIEIPIIANAAMISVTRQFEKGRLYLSKASESLVRLAIVKRKNGNTLMFVTTIVPSPKYDCSKKSFEDFRYTGGGNFTGKVFCSTLEGQLIEASQFVDGIFVGKLNITTRKQIEERKECFLDESYESVMLSSTVITKSSTYVFDEGGITESRCPVHPQHSANGCPLCMEEVIVRHCQTCGAKLEEGQTCRCKCSRCKQHPCKCCSFCHNFPCKCESSCPICRPGECSACDKCGRHTCAGKCIVTGGGGGKPEEGGKDENEDKNSKTPFLDAICSDETVLTKNEKEQIENGINSLKKKFPSAATLFELLANKKVKITIKIDPSIKKGTIKFNWEKHTLTFLNTECCDTYGALEDWAHVAQYEICYKTNKPSDRTTEFEAKMFCDLNCSISTSGYACAALEKGFENNADMKIHYLELLDTFKNAPRITSDFLQIYYKLGEAWNDPNYQNGTFDKRQQPKLLLEFFK